MAPQRLTRRSKLDMGLAFVGLDGIGMNFTDTSILDSIVVSVAANKNPTCADGSTATAHLALKLMIVLASTAPGTEPA